MLSIHSVQSSANILKATYADDTAILASHKNPAYNPDPTIIRRMAWSPHIREKRKTLNQRLKLLN